MFSRFDRILACDRTDGQTSCHGIVRAMHKRRAVIKPVIVRPSVRCQQFQNAKWALAAVMKTAAIVDVSGLCGVNGLMMTDKTVVNHTANGTLSAGNLVGRQVPLSDSGGVVEVETAA